MTYHPTLVPVGTLSPPPPGYDPSDYRVLARSHKTVLIHDFRHFQQFKSAKCEKSRFQTTAILKSTLVQAAVASLAKHQFQFQEAQFRV